MAGATDAGARVLARPRKKFSPRRDAAIVDVHMKGVLCLLPVTISGPHVAALLPFAQRVVTPHGP